MRRHLLGLGLIELQSQDRGLVFLRKISKMNTNTKFGAAHSSKLNGLFQAEYYIFKFFLGAQLINYYHFIFKLTGLICRHFAYDSSSRLRRSYILRESKEI